MKKTLNWISVGVSLATIHYGLGFLVGSGESIYSEGSIGIIYAAASALGIFSLIFIAPYYFKKKLPIWDLMGNEYGNSVRQLVASLSVIWMVGIVASQILGGAWALSLLGLDNIVSMVIISTLIFLLAVVNIQKLSNIFFYMLVFSSITLLLTLFYVGLQWVPISTSDFINKIPSLSWDHLIGTIATTVLVTFIGMDFHQFLVQAKSPKESIKGALLGGVILLILSLLLLAIITGAISSSLVGDVADAKQVVPSILMNFGSQISPFMGIIFLLPVILVSIGSGSGVTRVVARTITDLGIAKQVKVDNRLITVILAMLIAMTGKSIISLIVSFYAIYVASVFVPFILFVLADTRKISVTPLAIKSAIFGGIIGSLLIFINRFIPGSPLGDNQATNIMTIGILTSILGYIVTRNIGKK